MGMTADMQSIFEAQHAASRDVPAPSLEERRDLLATLSDAVHVNRDALADAIAADFGCRLRAETDMLEILPLLKAIRHTHGALGRWMRARRRPVAWTFRPGSAWVQHDPLGVVGIVSPWNYPLLLALGPAVDAIGAGNRVMLKPSELTPRFSQLLGEIVAARFSPDRLHVVNGGVDVGRAFASLGFDHLVFTGSTRIGREVAKLAAANMTPVTLELGGKSPAVILPDYPLDRAARSIVYGKFVNAGQTCIAPDYALVRRGDGERLARLMLAELGRRHPADAPGATTVITGAHRTRLVDAIEQARAAGATVYRHGGGAEGSMSMTLVLGAPPAGLLLTEEIFGPVLPIVEYDSIDEAVAFANARERPLALYCFTRRAADAKRILARIPSGGSTINGTLLHIAQNDLPFGGVGPSGQGAYHGEEGFRRFSHARGVFRPGALNFLEKIGPPWGNMTRRLVGRMIEDARLRSR